MGLEAEFPNFTSGDGAVARGNAMRQSRRIALIDWLVNMGSHLDGQAQRDQFYFEWPGSVGRTHGCIGSRRMRYPVNPAI